MEEAYWSQKKKHTNIFDAQEASSSSGQFPMSARPRPGKSKAPAPALTASSRSFSVASSTPAPPAASYDSISPASMQKLQCLQCNKLFTADLLTVYEGKKAFEDRNCRSLFIENIALQLTKGDSPAMHLIKTIGSKVELVQRTVSTGFGDAIIRATVFLAEHSSQSLFYRHLRQLEAARSHYLSYLRQIGNFEEAADIHDFMGEPEKAMMLRLAAVPPERWSESQHVIPNPSDKFFELANMAIRKQVLLTQRQAELDHECRQLEQQKAQGGGRVPAWMEQVPVPQSLRGVPLISTLLYVILFENNHKSLSKSSLWTKEFDVKDAHFRWLRVEAANICGDRDAIREALTASKGVTATSLFKSITRQTHVFLPPHRVARYLQRNPYWDALEASVSDCLLLVSDISVRYEWAVELGCWRVAVNCALESKNEPLLQNLLMRKLATKPELQELTLQVHKMLKTPVKSWKPI